MAKDRQEEHLDNEAQQRNVQQRQALSDVYGALEGEKVTNAFSAYTFEEALEAQVKRISGPGTKIRPNALERVDNMESKLLQSVAQLKDTDPELFREPDEDQDVNTPSNQSDE